MATIHPFPTPPARAPLTVDDFKCQFAELVDDASALPFDEVLVAIFDEMAERAQGNKMFEQLIDDLSWATVCWADRWDRSVSDLWDAEENGEVVAFGTKQPNDAA